MNTIGNVSVSGALSMKVTRKQPSNSSLLSLLWKGLPRFGLSREVFIWKLRNLPNFMRGFVKVAIARLIHVPHFYGQVSHTLFRANGELIDYGLVSLRVVTDTGVAYIVDAFQNTVELENMKFHGYGTGTNNEAAADSALQTELTTEYAVNSTRPTGSTTEGATGNVYRTVGTLSPDASVAITEHGIFSANAAGVLLDRSKFAVINLVSGDSLQTTYDLTFTSGS